DHLRRVGHRHRPEKKNPCCGRHSTCAELLTKPDPLATLASTFLLRNNELGNVVTEPTASEAARHLADAERLAHRVRESSPRMFVAWLAGVALASAVYLLGLGVANNDPPTIVALSAMLGASVLALSVGLLPGAHVT